MSRAGVPYAAAAAGKAQQNSQLIQDAISDANDKISGVVTYFDVAIDNLVADIRNLIPKKHNVIIGLDQSTQTSTLTSLQVIQIPFAQFPADMPTELHNLFIIPTVQITVPQANIGTQIGDQYQLNNYTYNGLTGNVWYGVQINHKIGAQSSFEVRLGDQAIQLDRVSGQQTNEIKWTKCYLIMTFVYWPI